MTGEALLKASKKAFRASIRTRLKALSSDEIESQSSRVTSRVISHPTFQRARTISCYLNMPSGEIDTSQLARLILQSGKILFVPRIDLARGEMDMLRIYDEDDLNSLPGGTWGIREPGLSNKVQHRMNAMDSNSPMLDLILLPGLAFDCNLARLGHGKGYYDRFLTSYQSWLGRSSSKDKAVKMPVLLGLALNPQLLDGTHDPIPVTDRDWKVDGVIYPSGRHWNEEIKEDGPL